MIIEAASGPLMIIEAASDPLMIIEAVSGPLIIILATSGPLMIIEAASGPLIIIEAVPEVPSSLLKLYQWSRHHQEAKSFLWALSTLPRRARPTHSSSISAARLVKSKPSTSQANSSHRKCL